MTSSTTRATHSLRKIPRNNLAFPVGKLEKRKDRRAALITPAARGKKHRQQEDFPAGSSPVCALALTSPLEPHENTHMRERERGILSIRKTFKGNSPRVRLLLLLPLYVCSAAASSGGACSITRERESERGRREARGRRNVCVHGKLLFEVVSSALADAARSAPEALARNSTFLRF